MKAPAIPRLVLPKPAKRTYNSPRPYCGDRVTVCIAGICDWHAQPSIIICTDTKLSLSGFTSFDSAIKIAWAAPNAVALMADDPSRAKELIHLYQRHMVLDHGPIALTRQNALDEVRKPAYRQKLRIIDEYFQRKWGVTYERYREGALNNLPERARDDIIRDVDGLTLGCQLIITPFVQDEPRLFTVSDDATASELDHFAVIGSGAWIANASLCQRQYNRMLDLKTALYYVYEAKKLSEAEGHVGKRTHMAVFQNTRMLFVSDSGMETLESWFWKFSPQPVANVTIPEDGFWITSELQQIPMASLNESATKDDSGSAENGWSQETQE